MAGGIIHFTYVVQLVMNPMIQHGQLVREFMVMRGLPDLQAEYNFAVACFYQYLRRAGVQGFYLHVQRVVQNGTKQMRAESVVVAFTHLQGSEVGDTIFTKQRRISGRHAPFPISIEGRNYDLWHSRDHMTNCAPDLHHYRHGYHDSKFLVFRHNQHCRRGEAIQRLGKYLDMRRVHSVVINDNESSQGVMIVVHIQAQVPKPGVDEFVRKTGFMCLNSGISVAGCPFGLDRIEPHGWYDWPRYHNMLERPTVTVDGVTFVAIKAKHQDEARRSYIAVLKKGSSPPLGTREGETQRPSALPPQTVGPMDEESGDGGGLASVATPLMGGTLTKELREVVSQMVHETVQVHVAEIDRILEDKIASLGQVLMTHLGGVIRNALPAPVDAAQQGHQLQRQLLPRHNNPRNV
jgi:hypothetical protein